MILPISIDLKTWAASLVIDFPNDNIPFLDKEENWKEWGNSLVEENSFARNGAPGTQFFKNWKTWAQAVFKTMANF